MVAFPPDDILASMTTLFSPKVRDDLKHYVYIYIDPRTKKPFYVGKGKGNRVFHHLDERRECEKVRRIKELRRLKLEPILEILKYGLNEKQALLVESTAIDLLDIEELTNEVRGHGSRYGTRGRVEDIQAELAAREVRIEHPALLVNIARKFHYGMTAQDLYDATRSAWVVRPERVKRAKYALAVYRSVVREVYEIAGWFRAGQTMRSSDTDGRRRASSRFEFVGKIAGEKVRGRYLGRGVSDYLPTGSQNPIRYVNCERTSPDRGNDRNPTEER